MLLPRWIAISFAAVALSGCATTAVQTEAVLREPPDLPRTHLIPKVEFIRQTENYCGPATLTMAMRHAGKMVGVDEIAGQVFTPGKKGTLQLDLISASRRQGMLAVQINGLVPMLREIHAGHPVIILENLGLSWYPFWHYALAIGYDLNEPEIILHSGPDEERRFGMRRFERSWMLADYWGLVVLPPNEMAASGDELGHAAGAAGLEQSGKIAEAELVYKNILKRWPGSLTALIGMGNITFARGEFQESVRYLEEATKLHPASAVAWHNRATAEGAAKRSKAARKSAIKALQLVPQDSYAAYAESLKEFI